MTEKQNAAAEEEYVEKLSSLSFGGISTHRSEREEDTAFKRKLEGELTEQLRDGEISTKTADAQAAIAGLCEGEKPITKREPVI